MKAHEDDSFVAEQVDERGNTALIRAVQLGRSDLVETLLNSQQANTSNKNQVGDTALHWACYRGDWISVAALLSHGAPFEVRLARQVASEFSLSAAVLLAHP